jgi:formylglycine-generating enzyme required for sulfatase activity
MPNDTPSTPIEPDLIPIPAGEFLLGSAGDRDAQEWETPQHPLYLPAYAIARTPITNAQYAAFLQDTDHRRPRRWRGRNAPRGKDHLPIVYVTWHDAQAYCQWLSAATGKPYRLPSEAQWEKAAAWDGSAPDGVKRRYPWGDRWDKRHCNTEEGGPDKITPVDAYPEGASPYGLLDVAGNVWEWTDSLWGPDWYHPQFLYPYDPADGREDLEAGDDVCRVIRGGSYAYARPYARCACRHRNFPNSYSDGIGFRVVLSLIADPRGE